MLYLKNGETSASCRVVTHHADSTETDTYSYFAYSLLNNAKNIYSKNRAIISEKTTQPSLVIYYYPQIFEYKLPLLSNELANYLSPDLNYIIQKISDNNYQIYNLIGYA